MSEFFSAIQLLATLAIGFVILGYSEYFIKTLTNFFHVDETMSDAEKECRSYIPDKDTRDNLKSAKVGNGDTLKSIEELRMDCKEMDDKVDNFLKQSKSELERKSKVRSLVSMSLFVFMATVALLFVPCLPCLWPQSNEWIPSFMLPFSLFCILYIVVGWIFGEKESKKKALRFSSLKHPIICFALVCIISAAWSWWSPNLIEETWKYFFVSLIIVGWLNFLMYAIFIKHSMNKFKAIVDELKAPIIKECKEKNLTKRCDELIVVKKMEELTNKNTLQLANNSTP